ncbi:MAG TPA: hypothetical protein VGQ06_09855 [Gemmatimonadales bacterium]|jgi:hypothetical protein|nr:hypothetical protein [Gemmatimonadales bacterium]
MWLWVMAMGAVLLGAAQARLRLDGNWQARAGDEIRHIMVRSDSSAQFGDQVARWRVVGDSLWITLGDGVWQVYGLKLAADKLTISGGDLEKPVTLRRVGPPSARPDTLPIPDPPPPTARAW